MVNSAPSLPPLRLGGATLAALATGLPARWRLADWRRWRRWNS